MENLKSFRRRPSRTRATRALSLCLGVALVLAATAALAQVAPIGGHHTTVGEGTGVTTVTSPTGGFATAVPLDLPSSRSGLPVPLQIRYTATTRAGAAGSGWDIPLSYVRISDTSFRRKPSVENDGTLPLPYPDKEWVYVPPRVFVVLDGAPILMVPGTEPDMYVPFAGDGYMELRRVGADWVLEVLGGPRYTFAPVYGHLLTRIEDPITGDRVELQYSGQDVDLPSPCSPTGGRDVNLSKISHTFSAEGDALFEIDLAYRTWGTADSSALSAPLCDGGYLLGKSTDGVFTQRRKIVDTVTVNARNNVDPASDELRPIRSYRASYSADPDTGLPRLSAVDLSGEANVPGPSSVPVTRYEYGSLTGAFYADPGVPVPRSFIAPGGGDETADYADGLSSSDVTVEEIDVTEEIELPSSPHFTARLETIRTHHVVRDFTGDGLPDLAFKSGGTWVLYPNRTTDSGTRLDVTPAYTWTEPSEIFEQTTFQFTGDTLLDLDARKAMVTTETWIQPIDWNGDGRMDIADGRHGDDRFYWKVWINEGLSGGEVVWRPENVFVDELRPGGTDPDFPFENLQDQVDRVTGFPTSMIERIDLGANGRFPLERMRSWPRTELFTCHAYNSYDEAGGYPEVACDLPNTVDQSETDSFTEWRIAEVNGDGFPDFITNAQPALYCERWKRTGDLDCAFAPDDYSLIESDGRVQCHDRVWQFAQLGVCPPREVGTGPAPLVTRAHQVFLNTGGSLFPAYAQEGDLFRLAYWRTHGLGGIGHWVNGEVQELIDESMETPEWSFEPGISREGTVHADPDGDGLPSLDDGYAEFASDRADVCSPSAPGSTPYTSRQTRGLVDINGDGIPDRVRLDYMVWRVRYGTGTGYGPERPLTGGGGFEISKTEGTCAGASKLVAGLLDLDGDGKPEVVRIDESGVMQASSLTTVLGTRGLDAGRLVATKNGHGATTYVGYANNKTEEATLHDVPFPEIVVREVRTEVDTGAAGPGLIPTRYAYGTARLHYDPLLARWSFPGYQRTVALTGDAVLRGADDEVTEGIAVITDRAPAAAPGSGYEALVLSSRVVRTSRLEALFETDPRLLLEADVLTDSRVRAGATTAYDTIEVASDTAGGDGQECFDANGTTGEYPLPDFDLCRRAGIVVAFSQEDWEGTAALPSTNNVLRGGYVESYDPLGRPTQIVDLGDQRRTDDDTCTTIQYAYPTTPEAQLLVAPSAIWVTDCGWDHPIVVGPTTFPGAPIIIAGVRFRYDGLAEGSVSVGRVTQRIVERRSLDGELLGELVAETADYNAMGLVARVIRSRALGSSVVQTTDFEHDRYGATITSTTAAASDVDVELTRVTRSPVWPSLPVEVVAPTGEAYQTFRDSLGRPIEDQARPVGAGYYIQAQSAYDDTPEARAVTATVFHGSTPAGTPLSGATRWTRATTHLDALGRPRFTQSELGGDYGGATVVSGFRIYDAWGRVQFEAAPFESNPFEFDPESLAVLPYGTTQVFDRGSRLVRRVDGPGLQTITTLSDATLDVYPTLFEYTWSGGLATFRTRGPSEQSFGGPSFGAWDEQRVTASGRSLSSTRYATASTKLDRVDRTYDRLGRVGATTRFKDPQAGTGTVVWTSEHDSLGNVVEQLEPGAAPVTIAYDEWGAPIDSTWLDGGVSRMTRWRYDGLGRLIERRLSKAALPNPVIEATDYFYYDAHSGDADQPVGPGSLAGRLSWSESPGVVSNFFSYDTLGRSASTTVVHADEQLPFRTTHSLSVSGTLDQIGFDLPTDDETIEYAYDSAARMKQVRFGDGTTTSSLLTATTIDALGRYRGIQLGNGVTETYDFQPGGRQELQTWTVHTTNDWRTVAYDEFDPEMRIKRLGERTSATNPSGDPFTNTTYSYDSVDRLTSALTQRVTTTLASYGYQYDRLGNMTRFDDYLGSTDWDLTYQAQDLDRLHQMQVTNFFAPRYQYAYDGAGNVVSHTKVAGSGLFTPRYFTYDSSSRIRTMQRGAWTASFQYGPGGTLAKEEVRNNGALDRLIRHYGPLMEHRTRTGGGQALERYVPGPLGVFASIRGTGASRSFVYTHSDGRVNRFFTRSDGSVTQSAEYQPYGTIRSQAATPSSQDYSDDLFNGGDTYSEFGVVVLGDRIYDSSLGRFLQRDPVVFVPHSTRGNPYTFSFADPINFRDPTGRSPSLLDGNTPGPDIAVNLGVSVLIGLLADPSRSGSESGGAPRAAVTPPPQIIGVLPTLSASCQREGGMCWPGFLPDPHLGMRFLSGLRVAGGYATAKIGLAFAVPTGGRSLALTFWGLDQMGAGVLGIGTARWEPSLFNTGGKMIAREIGIDESYVDDLEFGINGSIGLFGAYGSALTAAMASEVGAVPALAGATVHGNSVLSTRAQVVYCITRCDVAGAVELYKFGISGGGMTSGGLAVRAQTQVRALNASSLGQFVYKSSIVTSVPAGPGARQMALSIERWFVHHFRAVTGAKPPGNIRP